MTLAEPPEMLRGTWEAGRTASAGRFSLTHSLLTQESSCASVLQPLLISGQTMDPDGNGILTGVELEILSGIYGLIT